MVTDELFRCVCVCVCACARARACVCVCNNIMCLTVISCFLYDDMYTNFPGRSADVPTRKRYVALVESAKDGGGAVKVFSSLHVSGERK